MTEANKLNVLIWSYFILNVEYKNINIRIKLVHRQADGSGCC